MKKKSSIFNLNANIVILIAYLGGLLFKWLHVACYFAWAIPLIIYLIENKNEFVKKQSAQATLLFLISSIISGLVYFLLIIFAPTETTDIYNMIVTGSILLLGVLSLLSTIVSIAITVFAVVATVKTYNYEDYNIPYLSKYLDKFRSYLEILEGKNNSSCNCNECHCYEENTQKEYKKVRPHKIRKKSSQKPTKTSTSKKVQKIV